MDELTNGARALNVDLDSTQISQFEKLMEELKAWNEHTNLTAIRDDEGIIKKHFLDSLSVIQAIPKEAKNLIDVGSGAGFPGLPIAIVRPDLSVTLLEASEKKVEFLKHAVSALGLKNASAVNGRAEDIGKNPEHREKYDVAAARAVAELKVLAEYALPFVKIGGIMIAQKSADSPELENSKNALEILGGSNPKLVPIEIQGLEPRQLVIISKTKPTPSEYPRRSGMPSKKPL